MQAKGGMDKENEVEQGLARKAFVQKPLLQRPKALNERCACESILSMVTQHAYVNWLHRLLLTIYPIGNITVCE